MPAQYLLELYKGKNFKDINTIFNQYQDYAFSKGFFIIKLLVSSLDTLQPHTIFIYKHHSKYTQNYYKLDDFYGKNSNCQREATKVYQIKCGWSIQVAQKQLIKYIGLVYRWVVTLTCTKHADPDNLEAPVHDFITNSLAYISYQD